MKTCSQCQVKYPDVLEFCPRDGTPLPSLPGGAQPSYDPMIGTTIDGRYAIESRLGEGGMGMVYKARHVLIDKPVAIKILRKEAAQDTASVQRFIQEAKSASKINHSNIVDITDFGVLPDGHAYFVMEFLQGQTLAQAIQDGPMDPIRVCVIGAQMARGLHAAHQKGIVHRDLKPENVFLLEREGQADVVKIVDFGIAKIAGGQRLTQVGMVLGTPEYMSPEQATGAETDHRVDQYALGCIMYEMLTGVVPFLGERPAQTLTKHVFEALVPPGQRKPELHIPPNLEQIVVRTLGKKPAERFPSMRELELALSQEEVELRGPRSNPGMPVSGENSMSGMSMERVGDPSLPPQSYPPSFPGQPAYPGQPSVPYMPVYGNAQQPGSMALALPPGMVGPGVVVAAPFASGQGPAYIAGGWQPRPTQASGLVQKKNYTILVAVIATVLTTAGILGLLYMATRGPKAQTGNQVVDSGTKAPLVPTPPSAAPVVPPPVVTPPVKKTPETIQLVVDTDPAGAKLYLNGKAWAQDTPAMVTQPYGVTVRIEMRKKGFQTLVRTVRFDETVSKIQESLVSTKKGRQKAPPVQKGTPAPQKGGATKPPAGKPPTPTPTPPRYSPTPPPGELRDPFGSGTKKSK